MQYKLVMLPSTCSSDAHSVLGFCVLRSVWSHLMLEVDAQEYSASTSEEQESSHIVQ